MARSPNGPKSTTFAYPFNPLPRNPTFRRIHAAMLTSPATHRSRKPKIPSKTLSSQLPEPHNPRKRKVDVPPRRQPHPSKLRKRTGDGHNARAWVTSSRDLSSHKDRFVVASYNVLGDENVSKHMDLYWNVEKEDLEWGRRARRICKEIRRYAPSVLCLQEVDQFDDLETLLKKDGFIGVYKGRTGEANDGCAIFWKNKQFTLLEEENIEYQKFDLRHNVAQVCVFNMHVDDPSARCTKARPPLREKLPTRTFIVCNIHVLFNPSRGDIKLGQIRLLLERAHSLSRKWDDAPIVIAGDFNSMPQSALYRFLSHSELDILSYDRKKISVQVEYPLRGETYKSRSDNRYLPLASKMRYSWSAEEIFLAVGSSRDTHLQNPLRLNSAYPGVTGNSRTRDNNGEPLATTYHSKFMGTVDYIWHSQELVPVRVLETLPINLLRRTRGLPTQHWGSDHLALACELAFLDNATDSESLSET